MQKLFFLMTVFSASLAFAQPPGQDGGRPRGQANAVVAAIDANGDHEISLEEMKNAFEALKKLDKDNDGKLGRDEMHPEMAHGRGGPGHGEHDGGDDGSSKKGSRNNRTSERAGRGPGGGGPGGPGGGFGGPGGPGGGRGGPGGGQGGPGGPPDANQVVTDAMEFDADGDGMLSKTELKKFAEEHIRRGPPGRGGEEHGGGRGGDRGGRQSDRGDRPQRPRRPE